MSKLQTTINLETCQSPSIPCIPFLLPQFPPQWLHGACRINFELRVIDKYLHHLSFSLSFYTMFWLLQISSYSSDVTGYSCLCAFAHSLPLPRMMLYSLLLPCPSLSFKTHFNSSLLYEDFISISSSSLTCVSLLVHLIILSC